MLLMKHYQDLSGLERIIKGEKPEEQLFYFAFFFFAARALVRALNGFKACIVKQRMVTQYRTNHVAEYPKKNILPVPRLPEQLCFVLYHLQSCSYFQRTNHRFIPAQGTNPFGPVKTRDIDP